MTEITQEWEDILIFGLDTRFNPYPSLTTEDTEKVIRIKSSAG
jgi:hypothetical protein